MGRILTWGKPTLQICLLENGAIPANPQWITLDTPVENTTVLTPTDGDRREAIEEGGGIVDVYQNKSKYTLEFELFIKRDTSKPIEDEDGIITEGYAIRLIPEDNTLTGFVMKRTSVTVQDSWSSENGTRVKYVFAALTPAGGGKMLQEYKTPNVETLAATSITATGATLNAEIETGIETVSAKGFQYRLSDASSWTDVPVTNGSATSMSKAITGLTASKDYDFRAYITTASGTSYGSTLTFATTA